MSCQLVHKTDSRASPQERTIPCFQQKPFFYDLPIEGRISSVPPLCSRASLRLAFVPPTGPLFEGGKLVGQYRQTKAARAEATLEYQRLILSSFREVSDAQVSRQQLVEIRARQAHEVQALERAVKLSSERYVAGKASYYEVLEAQQQLFPSQLNLARTQRDQLLAVVALYKSLGGGWQDEMQSYPHP
jgi:outer membrane protein TolC